MKIKIWPTGRTPLKIGFIFSILVSLFLGQAQALTLSEQTNESLQRLEGNLLNPSVASGAVIASPSTQEPNYFFHWVRDAALVMETYVDMQGSLSARDQSLAQLRLQNWLQFESTLQNAAGNDRLGEPKFNVDGTLFTGPWGRPQDDGPALRSRTMGLWAQQLIENGQKDFAKTYLLSNSGPLKKDLDYTMQNWREDSFDVWEEVKGSHFFTRYAQLKTLQIASRLFEAVGDTDYSRQLSRAAKDINLDLERFWSSEQELILPMLQQTDGWTHKKSNLDLTVLLASLYFSNEGDEFGVTDSRVINSVRKLRNSFSFYELNTSTTQFIGRYPEDVYDGFGFSTGHPWFLANTAFAQYQCRLAKEWNHEQNIRIDSLNREYLKEFLPSPYDLRNGEVLLSVDARFQMILQGLANRAQNYFEEVLRHAGQDGSMSEQFSRYNGYMRGARDLSWSHASFIRAANECRSVLPAGL